MSGEYPPPRPLPVVLLLYGEVCLLESFFADLSHDELHSLPTDVSLQIPEGSQYGSRGAPLQVGGYKVKVEIDLSRYQLGAEGELPRCSLERLGIVPVRSLGKGKFGSLASLRFSFKTQYPPPPADTNPVVIRGVLPKQPAADTNLVAGDTIIAVNQHHVNIDTIDSVLATLSNKIQFLVKKSHRHSLRGSDYSAAASALLSPPPLPSPRMGSSGGLVRLVAGGRGSTASGGSAGGGARKQWRHLHMLLYITLDVKEDDPPEKVCSLWRGGRSSGTVTCHACSCRTSCSSIHGSRRTKGKVGRHLNSC